MYIYHRKAYYYETDRMQIIHHSNYIRWFEEARVAYFREYADYAFTEIEQQGITCPVLSVTAQYYNMLHFDEDFYVETKLEFYNGIRFKFSYQIKNQEKKVCCEGTTEHCFLHADGGIVRCKKAYPLIYDMLKKQLEKDRENEEDFYKAYSKDQ